MFKAYIQDNSYDIHINHGTWLNADKKELTFIPLSAESFKMIIGDREYIADLVDIDEKNKVVTIRIASKKYQIKIKEPVDLFLDQIGIQLPEAKKINNLIAPMPGLILKLMVKPGDPVKKGDALLILEAMKMENVFKAANDCIIKDVNVAEKQAVEKGMELITFE